MPRKKQIQAASFLPLFARNSIIRRESVLWLPADEVYILEKRGVAMNPGILLGLREARKAFPTVSFIVFGSQARGDARIDSDLDVCAIFPRLTKDPFELAFEVRAEIHRHLDMALDVVISDEGLMARQILKPWTLEAVIQKEGILV